MWYNDERYSTEKLKHLQTSALDAARELRNFFTAADESHLHFEVQISGDPHGDLCVTFSCNDSRYGTPVEGNSAIEVTHEYLRRKSYTDTMAPPLLTHYSDSETS